MLNAAQKIIGALVLSLLIGCGVAKRTIQPEKKSHASPKTLVSSKKDPKSHSPSVSARPLPPAMTVSKYAEVEVSLKQAYRDWKGTPYRLGGRTSRGIDCSAFMQKVFGRYFGIKLPRNTRQQLKAGTAIRRDNLRTGDLIFFKTGRRTLHVGVIVEGDIFLHASTSQGVTTSSLDDYYWKSRYLAARSVLYK